MLAFLYRLGAERSPISRRIKYAHPSTKKRSTAVPADLLNILTDSIVYRQQTRRHDCFLQNRPRQRVIKIAVFLYTENVSVLRLDPVGVCIKRNRTTVTTVGVMRCDAMHSNLLESNRPRCQETLITAQFYGSDPEPRNIFLFNIDLVKTTSLSIYIYTR